MASSTENHDGGYDLDFVEDPPEHLQCILCHLVLRDPVVLIACGHHYCFTCFERVKGHSAQSKVDLICPLDRAPIDVNKVFKDVLIQRLIHDLKVRCGSHSLGCRWTGEVRDFEGHRSNCNVKLSAANQHNTNDPLTDVVRRLSERVDHLERLIESTPQLISKKKSFFTWKIAQGQRIYNSNDNSYTLNSQTFFSYEGYECYLQLTKEGGLNIFLGKINTSYVAEINSPANINEMKEVYNKVFKLGANNGGISLPLVQKAIKIKVDNVGWYVSAEPVVLVCVLTHTSDDILAVQILSG